MPNTAHLSWNLSGVIKSRRKASHDLEALDRWGARREAIASSFCLPFLPTPLTPYASRLTVTGVTVPGHSPIGPRASPSPRQFGSLVPSGRLRPQPPGARPPPFRSHTRPRPPRGPFGARRPSGLGSRTGPPVTDSPRIGARPGEDRWVSIVP